MATRKKRRKRHAAGKTPQADKTGKAATSARRGAGATAHRHSLAIELTGACNQKCAHCYNAFRDDGGKSAGQLPAAELLALIDRALGEKVFGHVTLTGGEPFARPEIFEVLDVCKKHSVQARIISNGALITDEVAARLVPFKLGFVQVTLNGPSRELHEAHVGRGFFDKTVAGIDALARHGVPWVGCSVVTRKNASAMGAILERLHALGAESAALSRFSPAGYATSHVAALLPSRSDMIEALTQANAFGARSGMSLQVTMPIPPCVLEHGDYPNVRFGSCSIGTVVQEFALGLDGKLRNCTLHGASVGDPSEQSFAEIVHAPEVTAYRKTVPAFCEPCPHKSTCLGGCGAAAHWVLGGDRSLDPLVAQHVDDDFRTRLRDQRRAPEALMPADGLLR